MFTIGYDPQKLHVINIYNQVTSFDSTIDKALGFEQKHETIFCIYEAEEKLIDPIK